ncbi:hypothetical protein Pla52n_33680 [Stieleria varia]|uniref:Uncharacterized protein n=1 Tax=Stieleria varia TaxID=2528005 RepID=A0A5C6ARW7_9BACT|nr:hypothetical protein Pla52n_33680 [Stieleria varia]
MQLRQKLPRRHLISRTRARGASRSCHQPIRPHTSSTPHRPKRRCTFNAVTQVESCSRDPIGFGGSQWNLYEYVDSEPLVKVDPKGLQGHHKCCNGTKYSSNVQGCCGGKKIYSKLSSCCENGQVVSKVEIKVCRGRLGGDGSSIPVCGWLSHTFIICPDGKQYGKHPLPFDGCRPPDFLDMCGSGIGYVNEEVDRDPSKAVCKTIKVCPEDAKRMCKTGWTEDRYNLFCVPWGGTNCHSWGCNNSE